VDDEGLASVACISLSEERNPHGQTTSMEAKRQLNPKISNENRKNQPRKEKIRLMMERIK